jgi:hypothetical protein
MEHANLARFLPGRVTGLFRFLGIAHDPCRSLPKLMTLCSNC